MTSSRRASRSVRRACATLALAAALAPALAGCGDDDPDSTPDPTPSSGSVSPEPTEPTESTSAGASVTPAAGEDLTIRAVSMNGPEGWTRVADKLKNLGRTVRAPDGNGSVGLYSVPSLNPDASLDDIVASVESTGNFKGPVKVLDPVKINGVECYHITGQYAGGQDTVQFGANYGDDLINITFTFDQDFPEDQRQEVIDSVLASVQWN